MGNNRESFNIAISIGKVDKKKSTKIISHIMCINIIFADYNPIMYRKGSSLAAIKGYMAEEWEVNIKQVDNMDIG